MRRARPGDANETAAVLRASVSTSVRRGPRQPPEAAARWLESKTAHRVRTRIEGPGRVVVAEARRRIVGVGAATPSGQITLNCVLPEPRPGDASKAVPSALEEYLPTQGHARITIGATRTAHGFHRAAGYVETAAPHVEGGLEGMPMTKLSPPPART